MFRPHGPASDNTYYLGGTTALYTLSLVPSNTSLLLLLLLLICFVGYFQPMFLAAVSVFLFSVSFTIVVCVLVLFVPCTCVRNSHIRSVMFERIAKLMSLFSHYSAITLNQTL
jgi:hypothetical protein